MEQKLAPVVPLCCIIRTLKLDGHLITTGIHMIFHLDNIIVLKDRVQNAA
jgi:hypothetical protein